MTYINKLDKRSCYKLLVHCSVKKHGIVRSHNYMMEMKIDDCIAFANNCCRGLSHDKAESVRVIITLVFDCSKLYEVYLNNITVPFLGERYTSDGVKFVEPHYFRNPFFV